MQGSDKVLTIGAGLAVPLTEIKLEFSRSGGPGGQHVNKVSTRVTISFDIMRSHALNAMQRERVLSRLKAHVGTDGLLRLTEQGSRSQWQNRQKAIKRLQLLLQTALKAPKRRIGTRSTASAQEDRLRSKRVQARKKEQRRRRDDE